MICDGCRRWKLALNEVEQDGERFALCDDCFGEEPGFDMLLGTRFETVAAKPEPRDFDWENQ